MSRNVLVIGGVALVAAAVALYFLVLKSADETPARQASSDQGSAVVVATTPGGTPAPSLPGAGSGPSFDPGTGEHPRDYVVGDVRVRDHRAGNNPPLDIPPNVHPAEGREIPSSLTHEIAQKIKAVMMECAQQIPREARGDKPRLEGQVIIAIKDQKVTITKSVMQLRQIEGAAVEPTKQCIESKTIGIENPAPDQADLDSYSINITFAIP